MLKSFLNFFNKPKLNNKTEVIDDDLMLISGLFVEAAAIDGEIDKSEIYKIQKSLVSFLNISEEKSTSIVSEYLNKIDETNSLYFFTSKINKEYKYDKKIQLLEFLWGIILADGEIHDFESNLVRRLSGLLYVSDVDCGNAKKRVSIKLKES